MIERSEVQYGRTRIPYAIRRSARRGTVAVAVEPTGEVLLTAPTSTPIERLDRVVQQKARWIVERWRHFRALLPSRPAREFISGETFSYLGRQYRLVVRDGDCGVRLRRGRIEAEVPEPDSVRPSLVTWYQQHARQRLPERVHAWLKKVGVREPKVVVREQQKRWGSCDASGIVRLNWRIIQAPMSLVDYVVVHELVHLHHRDHTAAFWAALGRAMPDYERRRAELQRWGTQAVW